MFNRKMILSVAATACLFVPSLMVAQTATAPAAQTAVKTGKTIKFTVANKTSAPIDLKSGEEQMTIAAGASRQVKAPAGTKIVTTSASPAGEAGTVVAEVTNDMGGSTVNVR